MLSVDVGLCSVVCENSVCTLQKELNFHFDRQHYLLNLAYIRYRGSSFTVDFRLNLQEVLFNLFWIDV